MAQRSLVYAPIAALTPADVNPKLHDLPALVASLVRYGFTDPILLDERTGKIVAGHGRRLALIDMKDRGEAPPGGVFVDEDGDWLVPVVRGWYSRDDTEAWAYIIADNQLTVSGGWHRKTLAQMLEHVVTDDAPLMETLGFAAADIDTLLARVDPDTILPSEHDDDPWDSGSREDTPITTDPDPEPEPASERRTRDHTCPACGFTFEE
ncbi:MAG TPA: hypothetical protein VGF17_20130 [Phytomonospora sp.]